jgi:hypothetical protein
VPKTPKRILVREILCKGIMDNMLGKHRGYLEFSVTAFGQNRVGHLRA